MISKEFDPVRLSQPRQSVFSSSSFRLSEWVFSWVNGRITELITLWEQVGNTAPDQATLTQARRVLGELRKLRGRVAECVRFDESQIERETRYPGEVMRKAMRACRDL